MLTDQDIYLFREGTHAQLHSKLGCRLLTAGQGAHFAVWAPNAAAVSVIGDWNGWNGAGRHPRSRGPTAPGIWEGPRSAAQHGQAYKYRIASRVGGYRRREGRSVRRSIARLPPATASRGWTLEYEWRDCAWMAGRAQRNGLDAPMSIYELHVGSWRRRDGNFLNYRELAHELAHYVHELGFTHVELMPVTEHPFYGSWGYQTTGYFAPTARYGTPQDLMYFVDHLHAEGIGVILDWVPSHFPTDEHGLVYFDGTHLYEHADPQQGFHPEWKSAIFNFGRNEVRSFLLSSALFWFDKYHIDGIRVDAVASMLYLDYARKQGEWIPNRFGGRENLEATEFLRMLNQAVYRDHPDCTMIAEESTAWPMVSRPTDMGGLGFGLKWNMGWMHDTLEYMKQDPIHRRYHHGQLTFSLIYAFNENFVLPLSHDEVVYGKGSLIGKMPGDDWRQFANLRTLYGYMWAHPGKKLLFMGGEFGQRREWTHEGELEWWVAELPEHAGVRHLVRDLNRDLPRRAGSAQGRLFARWLRMAGYRQCGGERHCVPAQGAGRRARRCSLATATSRRCRGATTGRCADPAVRGSEILNTDAREYGGAGWGNLGGVESVPVTTQGRLESVNLNLPPLATIVLRWESRG